jgi:hypothetical protein
LQGLRMIAHDGRTGTSRETDEDRSTYVRCRSVGTTEEDPHMRSSVDPLRIRWLTALVVIAIAIAACTAPAGGTAPPGSAAPVNGASPAPAAPTSGGYSY